MTRLERINRTYEDLGIASSGGLTDLMDNAFKGMHRVNDDEYDFICDNATDEELDILVPAASEELTFSEKRKMLNVLNKLMGHYNEAQEV